MTPDRLGNALDALALLARQAAPRGSLPRAGAHPSIFEKLELAIRKLFQADARDMPVAQRAWLERCAAQMASEATRTHGVADRLCLEIGSRALHERLRDLYARNALAASTKARSRDSRGQPTW